MSLLMICLTNVGERERVKKNIYLGQHGNKILSSYKYYVSYLISLLLSITLSH